MYLTQCQQSQNASKKHVSPWTSHAHKAMGKRLAAPSCKGWRVFLANDIAFLPFSFPLLSIAYWNISALWQRYSRGSTWVPGPYLETFSKAHSPYPIKSPAPCLLSELSTASVECAAEAKFWLLNFASRCVWLVGLKNIEFLNTNLFSLTMSSSSSAITF